MYKSQHYIWSRRAILQKLGVVSSAGLFGFLPKLSVAAEPPPETTSIRVLFDPDVPILCFAPQYVAEQFLRMEGFTDVRFVPNTPGSSAPVSTLVADGADITAATAPDWVVSIDKEEPIVVLGGLHAGCYELFAQRHISTIRELKHKRIAVVSIRGAGYHMLASVVAQIGLDPAQDIEWVEANPKDWADMLENDQVDAILTLPPTNYAVHARNIGHVILNTTTDNPWRYYFCCMFAAQREYVTQYPVASKRAMRAMIKANQLCSLEPQRTAKWLVENNYASNYKYTLQTLLDTPYGTWHDYDPDDTLRFYALRLHEVGLIKHTPQEIIEQGTDWRFLNELKQELKA